MSISATTGAIDVSASTPGAYTVTYTTVVTCPNSSDVSITVNVPDDALFNYVSAAYCADGSDPTPTITGIAGGTFFSSAGLSINSSTGAIDVSASTPGAYAVTYTTAGDCPTSSGVSVTINAVDDASFSYDNSTYCDDWADPTPTITGVTGGTFSSTTGVIDVSASTAGNYTVTYTTAGTCPSSSGESVSINFIDDTTFIDSDGITIVSNTGGTYQWIDCRTNQPISGATNLSYTTTYEGSFAVEVTQNGCYKISECVNMPTMGINSFDLKNSVSIAPNPATSEIKVVTNENITLINIYNYLGQLVTSTMEETVDVNGFETGIYFVKITTDKGIVTKKFIKK